MARALGRRWASTGSSGASIVDRARRRRRPSSAATFTTRRRASSSPTSSDLTPARRRRRSRSTRRSSIPDDARRPRPRRDRPRDRARARAARAGSGAGPHETYPDRKRGGLRRPLGSRPSTDQYVPYIRPQENGGHADVRWLELRDAGGRGLRIDARRAAPGLGRPTSAPPTSPRRPTTSTLVPVAETIVHLDAAHRGLGTASCGPDTLPEYLLGAGHVPLGAGPCATRPARPDDADRPGRPRPREFHLHNDRISYVMRVHENGSLGHLHFGAALAAGRSYAPPRPGRLRGLLEPRRRPGRPRVPDDRAAATTGSRRSTVEHADGSTVLDLAYAEPPDRRRQAAPTRRGLPATYVEADDEADTLEIDARRRAERPRGRPRRTRSSATARSSPAAPGSATTAPAAVRLTGAMSASLDLPDADWDLVQLSGAWAREHHVVDAAAASRPPVGRQRPRRRRATSTTRSSPCAARRRPKTRGEAYGFSLVYSGNFLAEAEVDPFDTDPRPDRDQPDDLRAGRSSRARRSRRPRRSSPTRTPGSAA